MRHLVLSLCATALVVAACGGNDVVFGPSGTGGASAGGGEASTTTTVGQGGASTTTSSSSSGGAEPCGGVDCAAIPTPACARSVCNQATDQCEVVDEDDGVACDDGLFCTINTVCQGGVCTGGEENTCGVTPSGCEVVTCDESSQTCAATPGNEGAPCTPADPCQLMGTCAGGTCVGAPKDCSFVPLPSECFVPACNPMSGVCEAIPGNDGQPCLDGDLCTVGTVCAAGSCGGGSPVDCTSAGDACNAGVCNPASGQCEAQPANDGMSCDDGSACTAGDVCAMGTCSGMSTGAACGTPDGCCPAGCSVTADPDCTLSILLMGDDVNQAGWNTYRQALTSASATWTERDLDVQPFPSLADLSGFNTLVWFDDAFVAAGNPEFQVVVDWIDAAAAPGTERRHIFVTSRLFLTDMENGAVGQGERNLYDRIGADRVGQTASINISVLLGVPADPLGGSFAPPADLPIAGNGSLGDYASTTMGLATAGLIYGPGGPGDGTGDAALTHYDAGTYKAAWLGVNFHDGITAQTDRDQLMADLVGYFSQ